MLREVLVLGGRGRLVQVVRSLRMGLRVARLGDQRGFGRKGWSWSGGDEHS